MLALLVCCTPVWFLASGKSLVIEHANFADDSWMVDIVYKAMRGVWLGRDVIFTYGCLYQALISWPVRLFGFSLGAARLLPEHALMWALVVLTFLTSRLLLNAEPAWKRAVFIVLIFGFLGTFWTFTVRTAADLFLFSLFLTCVERVAAGRWRLLKTSCLIAASLLAGFLLSADTGFYALIALVIVFVAGTLLSIRTGGVPALARLGAVSAMVFVALAIVVNVFLGGGLLRFRFLQDSLAIVSSYRWLEPSPLEDQDARVLIWTALAGLAIMLAAWFWKDPKSEAMTRRPLFLCSAPLVALAMLQTGVVRSDWYHVAVALYPMIFLALAVLCGTGTISILRSTSLVLLAIVLASVLAGPNGTFTPAKVADAYRSSKHPDCGNLIYVDRACFGPPEGQALWQTTQYLRQHTAAEDSVVIYPYENLFGDAARRDVAGGVLQNYLVGGSYLVRRQLEGLQAQKPTRGLYFVDRPEVWRIDGISNFTRTPDVWLYLQSHYRMEAETAPGVFALVRDDERAARVQQKHTPVPELQRTVPILDDRKFENLGRIDWPGDADFLKLTIRAHYSRWWKLRKPSGILFFLNYKDGSRRQFELVVQPNVDCVAWLYPWDEQDLWRFFSTNEADWHDGTRPTVVSVEIYVARHDSISMLPKLISIRKAEAVRLTERQL